VDLSKHVHFKFTLLLVILQQFNVGETCDILRYYAVLSSSSVIMFRDNLSVPSWTSWPSNMGPIDCAETSVHNYHLILRNIPEQHGSQVHRGGSLQSRNLMEIFFFNVRMLNAAR
jgi:hypothetical protein